MSDTGRSHDVQELQHQYRNETNPERRQMINDTIHRIRNESGAIRSMREALIKAHRSGDKNEIKDVHDYIKDKGKYR